MRPAGPARVRALSIHAGYRCHDSGVCCSSGWAIAVEPEIEQRLRGLGVRSCVVASDTRLVLGHDTAGRCVFLEGRPGATRCSVHRRLGPAALPSACRQFPRVVTLAPTGVSVTLSHYCPTAADLLFADRDAGVRIVEDAPAFPPDWSYEGLDAREALAPLLRPGVLSSWSALERWEGHAVATLSAHGLAPERALSRLAAQAEAARRWTPREGDFDAFLARVLATADRDETPAATPGAELDGWDLVASTVPAAHPPPRRPDSAADPRSAGLVDAGWATLAQPVGRWLAAKAFASWLTLQGDGLRTSVLGLHVALAVLRAEAAAGCATAGRALDAALLKDAVRRADLLLLHLADPAALAGRLSRCERGRVLGSNLPG